MSAYANDPRVTDLGGDVYLTAEPRTGEAAYVKCRPGVGFVAAIGDGEWQSFDSADEALAFVIGDPQ